MYIYTVLPYSGVPRVQLSSFNKFNRDNVIMVRFIYLSLSQAAAIHAAAAP